MDPIWFQADTMFDIFLSSWFLPAQYLANAAVAHSELSGDITGSHSLVGQFHNSLPDNIWERAAIHKHTPKLIHPAMPCIQCTKQREKEKKHCSFPIGTQSVSPPAELSAMYGPANNIGRGVPNPLLYTVAARYDWDGVGGESGGQRFWNIRHGLEKLGDGR